MTEPENDWRFTKTPHFALNWGLSIHPQHPDATLDDSIHTIPLSAPIIPTWRLPLQFSHQHILCLSYPPPPRLLPHVATIPRYLFTTLTFHTAVHPP
jgi:hypothetical protein